MIINLPKDWLKLAVKYLNHRDYCSLASTCVQLNHTLKEKDFLYINLSYYQDDANLQAIQNRYSLNPTIPFHQFMYGEIRVRIKNIQLFETYLPSLNCFFGSISASEAYQILKCQEMGKYIIRFDQSEQLFYTCKLSPKSEALFVDYAKKVEEMLVKKYANHIELLGQKLSELQIFLSENEGMSLKNKLDFSKDRLRLRFSKPSLRKNKQIPINTKNYFMEQCAFHPIVTQELEKIQVETNITGIPELEGTLCIMDAKQALKDSAFSLKK